MLTTILEAKLKEDGLSVRQAAKITGVAHTTILRAMRGDPVDLETIFGISEWLEVKPSTLVNSMSKSKDALADQIAVVIEQSPKLASVFQDALDRVLKGRIPPSIIEDIAAYAAYKINLVKES